ncbi:Crp/Fnr family transcriptional regulator [Phenylobacterium sp. J367]|uniref:Crp/Fnr family transcriptional regulator n=1 Tax=Phenylobacterium sp. J367 TaxID=2898435 RepID=UPI002151E5F2|nr:Crp/Fnr family transcriptional regulator [Phenylobacterium sp. J367]MCR5880811.1 Crp/Fnr family transcriptional regulator [Phenylobacterium sp. J367]
MHSSIDRLLRKLRLRWEIPPDAAAALESVMQPPRRYARGEEMIAQFAKPNESTLMVAGVAGRLVTLEDGAEQVTALHIAGDFVDLHSLYLRRQDHSVVALDDCVVATAPHGPLAEVATNYPAWALAFGYLLAWDAAVHRRWIVMLGRQTARAAFAHLICELWTRNRDVGLAEGPAFDLPLTQVELANVLGLSTVHANRVVQSLRAEGLIRWRSARVEILDWDRLAALAQFDTAYLQH